MDDELVPKKQAHHKVGVSRATIDRWHAEPEKYPGKPPRVFQGNRVYYRRSDLNDYISGLPAASVAKAHHK